MPSPDTVPFTLSEGDAHTSHQNTQQVIESIMQVIKELLKHLNQPEKEKAPPDEEKDPQADEKVISLPELAEPPVIEPVYVQQQTLSLEGARSESFERSSALSARRPGTASTSARYLSRADKTIAGCY